MPSPSDIETILQAWPTACGPIARLDAGHINDTWTIGERHILQRLSRHVFGDPQAVIRNLARAIAHEGGRRLVGPIAATSGEAFAQDAGGDVWRLFPRVPSRSFQTLPDALLEAAGAAFGGFLTTFADFPHVPEPVIDGFHDLEGYLDRLDAASHAMPEFDWRHVETELHAVDALRGVFRPGTASRIIHGDCKVNNLLFHPNRDRVAAVIDLDTFMLGDPAWDFGDLVRSAFAGAEEADAAGAVSLPRFARLCRGFVAGFDAIDDVDRYATAPAYMSFMLAVRFLTDHMQGDVYFKVRRRGDNLLRARSQLDLAERFLEDRPSLTETLTAVVETARMVP